MGVGGIVLFDVMSRPSGDFPLTVGYWSLKLIIHLSTLLRQICFLVLTSSSPVCLYGMVYKQMDICPRSLKVEHGEICIFHCVVCEPISAYGDVCHRGLCAAYCL